MYLDCFVYDECIVLSGGHKQSQHHILKMATQLSLQLLDEILQAGGGTWNNQIQCKCIKTITYMYLHCNILGKRPWVLKHKS